MNDWINFDAVRAVWKRQFWSLLGNPLGYVFVLGFVLVAAGVLFWPDVYFNRNITDLGDLLNYMPWLLVVLIPALTMGSWASERELGTEEQLLTLPMNVSDALLLCDDGATVFALYARTGKQADDTLGHRNTGKPGQGTDIFGLFRLVGGGIGLCGAEPLRERAGGSAGRCVRCFQTHFSAPARC